MSAFLVLFCISSRRARAIAQAWVPARPALMWTIREAGPVAGIDDGAEAPDFVDDAYQNEHTIPLVAPSWI